MSPIPWGALLTHGPAIVSAARSLLATQSAKAPERTRSLDARIDHLEKTSIESARLLEEMAEQLQALTLAQQETQRRLRLAVLAAVGAAVVAVGALVYALAT
jgi:hypothetical protein